MIVRDQMIISHQMITEDQMIISDQMITEDQTIIKNYRIVIKNICITSRAFFGRLPSD